MRLTGTVLLLVLLQAAVIALAIHCAYLGSAMLIGGLVALGVALSVGLEASQGRVARRALEAA